MQLYHYRPIDSALKEIGNGTFYYASIDELNDPVEGYVRVYWQGDKAAWEGLFRNYICSLYQAIDLYLLVADKDILHHKTLLIDLHAHDDVPPGKTFETLGREFLTNHDVQKLASFYGGSYEGKYLKVSKEELELILYSIHRTALMLCIQYNKDHSLIPPEEADSILKAWSVKVEASTSEVPSFEDMDAGDKGFKDLIDDDKRTVIVKIVKNILEDGIERTYVQLGLDDRRFLYGSDQGEEPLPDTKGKKEADKSVQHRNWMSVSVDFPKIYVDELRSIIYPESYVVCFSGKDNDSAMWGNYADHHKGVCLVYDFEENSEKEVGNHRLKAKPVSYGGELIERNFFTTFGRLNISQVKTWLTGTEGVSELFGEFSDATEWRDRYWEAYEAKTYRKLKAWEYEDEYRLVICDMLRQYTKPESRNLRFDYKSLRGVIFGISTSEYDKMRVLKELNKHREELANFTFYQAEYDDEKQEIAIREKSQWKFKK